MGDGARRLFVGVPVSLETVDALAGATESLARRARQAGLPVRWLAPATYHVTLAFLGWCRPEAVDAVAAAVREVAAGAPALRFMAARLGAFPSPARASIVWAGVDDAGGRLAGLAGRLGERMAELGFRREARRFHAHVTIGRLRTPGDVSDVLLPLAEQAFSETRAREIVLYESRTKSAGSEYTAVATAPLGAG